MNNETFQYLLCSESIFLIAASILGLTGSQILNACVPSRQWKAVSWVFIELRKLGLRPNGATYGLAMEVIMFLFTNRN